MEKLAAQYPDGIPPHKLPARSYASSGLPREKARGKRRAGGQEALLPAGDEEASEGCAAAAGGAATCRRCRQPALCARAGAAAVQLPPLPPGVAPRPDADAQRTASPACHLAS